MKKKLTGIIAAFICMLTVISVLPLSLAETSPDYLDFTVASDLHLENAADYGDVRNDSDYDADNPYWGKTIQGQLGMESEAINAAFINEFIESDSEILLLPGDLTNGKKVDHAVLAALLAKAEAAGKSCYVINGNHDIDDDREDRFTTADMFKDCYAQFGYDEALVVDKNSCSYTADLNEKYRLIAIDSCVYGKDDGEIDDEMLAWILEQTAQAQLDGRVVIAMMHHSILTHFPLQVILDNYMELAEAFADAGIKYVFTGHMHGNDISEAVTKNGNKIFDIMTGSLITYPFSYREISCSPESMVVETEYLTEIDTDLLPYGFTQQQIDMINEDFPAYGKGFFTEGMKYWIDKRLGTAKQVSGMLNVEEGTKAYEALDTVMGYVGDALNLPIYNTEATPGAYDSIEEVIGLYGYTLPDSDYEYIYEIVSAVMGGFFEGDEHMTDEGPEIQIMLSAVPGGLTYALTELAASGETEKTDALFKALGIGVSGINGSLAPVRQLLVDRCADALIGAVVVPIVEGISDDEFAPADLNVTLEGWAQTSADTADGVPLTMFNKIIDFMRDFFRILTKYLFTFGQ